jgi:hypothetical protein
MDLNRSDLFNCVFGDISENLFDRNEHSLLYTHNFLRETDTLLTRIVKIV